jgi:inhibitor of cysteine peptidase
MTLTQADNGTAVTIRPGEQVAISLAENPTTGFQWALEQGDDAILKLLDSAYVRAAGPDLGSGGRRVLTFEAKNSGTVRLSLKLWRAWEGDSSIRQRFEITIQVTN